MPKILDYIEYVKTEDGWISRKVHDDGDFIMDRRDPEAILEDISYIERGQRPPWTLLGLPRIIVNGKVFRERDEI
ncbi:MAG: hypothetical protein KatS3mg115_2210 [Candidatus Poribacteria bacterium]|nr:MAG: hypothetical protein KatS3mg115_2210 [Candidatus Poribacteria bacterium]